MVGVTAARKNKLRIVHHDSQGIDLSKHDLRINFAAVQYQIQCILSCGASRIFASTNSNPSTSSLAALVVKVSIRPSKFRRRLCHQAIEATEPKVYSSALPRPR